MKWSKPLDVKFAFRIDLLGTSLRGDFKFNHAANDRSMRTSVVLPTHRTSNKSGRFVAGGRCVEILCDISVNASENENRK